MNLFSALPLQAYDTIVPVHHTYGQAKQKRKDYTRDTSSNCTTTRREQPRLFLPTTTAGENSPFTTLIDADSPRVLNLVLQSYKPAVVITRALPPPTQTHASVLHAHNCNIFTTSAAHIHTHTHHLNIGQGRSIVLACTIATCQSSHTQHTHTHTRTDPAQAKGWTELAPEVLIPLLVIIVYTKAEVRERETRALASAPTVAICSPYYIPWLERGYIYLFSSPLLPFLFLSFSFFFLLPRPFFFLSSFGFYTFPPL